MEPLTLLKKKADKIYNSVFYQRNWDHRFLNFQKNDGEKNWQNYDHLCRNIFNLEIDWTKKESLSCCNVKEDLLFHAFLFLRFQSRAFRFFAPSYFRQAEFLHGTMTIQAENYKILLAFYHYFQPWMTEFSNSEFDSFSQEYPFLDGDFDLVSPLQKAVYLYQHTLFMKDFFDYLHLNFQQITDAFLFFSRHYQFQADFFMSQMKKNLLLSKAQEKLYLPTYHYLEGTPLFDRFFKLFIRDYPGEYENHIKLQEELSFLSFCETGSVFKNPVLQIQAVQTVPGQKYKKELDELVELQKEGMARKYEQFLDNLQRQIKLEERFMPQIADYYFQEISRTQWHLHELESLIPNEALKLSQNDLDLAQIIKEIAYCEGFAYTIGQQNIFHAGELDPFALWIFQQGHEEMKHFHAIRFLLKQIGVCTEDLDEEFLASTFEEPTHEAFKDCSSVFLINFLGEVHNIRAYILLAQSLDSPVLKLVMKKILDDEVVHKKVFAKHFLNLCEKENQFEKQSYECLMDGGLGVHQAGRCCRYKVMMKKIGEYYLRSGKANALEFLNMSLRAQYMELKSLFSPDLFKVSEFEFRRRHLRAFVF